MANPQPNPRPIAPEHAPDTARTYERAKPEKESGMGRLDNNSGATPAKSPDQMEDAVTHKQPLRQINSDDVVNQRAQNPADGATVNSLEQNPGEHLMFEQEAMDGEQASPHIKSPRNQPQPRSGGKGGMR
jgi:hypothetical protein